MKPDKKKFDVFHKTTMWLVIIVGYLMLFMMTPVVFFAILGLDAWKIMWIEKVFDPLTIPSLTLTTVAALCVCWYGYGYFFRGYPSFLYYDRQLKDERT